MVRLPRLSLIVLMAGCSAGDIDGDAKRTGIDLTIEYDSSLAVRSFQYRGIGGDGVERASGDFEAPVFVEPPGVRVVDRFVDITEPGALTFAVDGVDGAGSVVGTSAAAVVIASDEVTPLEVRLGSPVACGDGRRGGLEACDDGNNVNGDGCSATCELEPDVRPNVVEVEALTLTSTDAFAFVAVPGGTLEFEAQASDAWIVFVSGRMRSTSTAEISGEMRLLANDDEVDLWGHQADTGDDNWAGFVTFVVLTDVDATQTIQVQFRAEEGATEVSDLRLVAVRLRADADLHHIDEREILEAAGSGVNLAALTVTPQTSGAYIVLAKASATEQPSEGTVRTWLERPDGARLPEDDGAAYGNPRDSWVPMFAVDRATIETEATYALRGTSSASGLTPDWWDTAYDHRERVTVTSGATVTPERYALSVTIDHESWVTDGAARADGRDVRVVYDGVEIDRVVDPDAGWNLPDTRLWFALPRGLRPNEEDKAVVIYHGHSAAPDPPEDPDAIFLLHDDFANAELDPQRWIVVSGEPTIAAGRLKVGPGTLLGIANEFFDPNTIVETNANLSSEIGNRMRWMALYRSTEPAISFYADGSDHHAQTLAEVTHFTLEDVTVPRRYAIARESAVAVRFFQDDAEIAVHRKDVPLASLGFGMDNTTPEETMTYDWIRVRPYVFPEPTTAVTPDGSLRGGSPSRWIHRRIVAFRADAWASESFAASREGEDVEDDTFTAKVTLTTPATPTAVQYVTLQTERVSGEANPDGRKVGELRANDETLMATSHRTLRGTQEPDGYHHVAGVVDARTTADAVTYENGCRSPDGIVVRCADSVILVLQPE